MNKALLYWGAFVLSDVVRNNQWLSHNGHGFDGHSDGHMLKSNQKMLLNVKSNPEPQMEGGGCYICTLRRFFRQLLEKLLVYKLHFRDL